MEDAVRVLTERKISELLALFGIHNHDQEALLQHVDAISGFVRDSWRKAGLKAPPAGASRVLRAAKRRQVDYAGSDRKPRKKRRNVKPNNDPAETGPVSKDQESSAGRVCLQQACSTNEPIIVENTVYAYADAKLPADTLGALAATLEDNGSCEPDQAASKLPPSTEGNIQTESPGASQADVNVNTQLTSIVNYVHTSPTISSVLEFFGSAVAFKVMESILQHCVHVNLKLAKYKTGEAVVTTNIQNIQRYASSMANLEYNEAVYAVKKSRALAASQDIQVRYNESFYWDIILKTVRLIDPATVKNRGGPADEFTQVEKDAAKVFMDQAGMGTGSENQRQRRRVWKQLWDMRRAGVDKILLYRTREFDNLCEQNPKHDAIPLVERVSSWEKVYGEHLTDLATRAMEEARGGLTGQLWLNKTHVAERLDKMPQNAWNDFKIMWRSSEEEAAFHLSSNTPTASTDHFGHMLDLYNGVGTDRNKSLYVILVPRDVNFLSVRSIITIHKGDFLGFFTGYLRYSEDFDDVHGIRGPTEKLWLDYSEVTGLLTQMKVVAPGGDANVALHWESVEGDAEALCVWRVAVRALRNIRPFNDFVRVAQSETQFLLHQEPACARTGFTKSINARDDAMCLEEVRGCT